jgi:hypothetical protein
MKKAPLGGKKKEKEKTIKCARICTPVPPGEQKSELYAFRDGLEFWYAKAGPYL